MLAAIGFALIGQTAVSGMTVGVSASISSPAPVATPVTFTAVVSGEPTNNNWYRFSVRQVNGPYRIIRDYGPVSTLMWTASDHEGTYEIEVAASNLDTGDTASGSATFEFDPIATVGPVVSPTANSLIFLYSAPPCPAGRRIHVEFTSPDGIRQATPFKDCTPLYTTNFYLAGLRPNTTYTAQHAFERAVGHPFVGSAGPREDPEVTFTTGNVLPNLYSDTILIPSPAGASNPYLLGSSFGGSPVANDLGGNVVWYGPNMPTWSMTNPEPGGAFWGIVEVTPADPAQELIREIDLTGMTLLETNAARINEQLAFLGKRQITAFHHEARTLSGGQIAVLGDVEQILTNVQGPGPVDVIGDMIIVLNQDLNVVWTWDTFDNLDVTRKAVLGETCAINQGACPPHLLASDGNDWTHGNAVTETPDGNLLYSTRNQDWVIKISYDHGNGDGHIIWKMGADGDFQINSRDPYPWFSHQHDPHFASTLLVFDDGNTRVSVLGGGNSRGQALQVDEQNMVVTPVLNADLGYYTSALGSAQLLLDGNYHFDVGFVQENNTIDSYSLEVDPNGQIVYNAHQNTTLYRTFRMASMYSVN
jgi:arylsulfate sulfotransferase